MRRPVTSLRTDWPIKRGLRKRSFGLKSRKAAVQRQTALEERSVVAVGHVKPAERGLIWGIMRDPAAAVLVVGELEDQDLEGLATGDSLRQARSLQGCPGPSLPPTLLER